MKKGYRLITSRAIAYASVSLISSASSKWSKEQKRNWLKSMINWPSGSRGLNWWPKITIFLGIRRINQQENCIELIRHMSYLLILPCPPILILIIFRTTRLVSSKARSKTCLGRSCWAWITCKFILNFMTQITWKTSSRVSTFQMKLLLYTL